MITQENFEKQYSDPIVQQQIDKFVCVEMGRQIHRYIKGMSGTLAMMHRFEEQLAHLNTEQREQAIARYIDLNRKVLDGLDLKVVLARAIANYCDTFSYMLEFINDKQRVNFYLARIKSKYIQYHQIYEENGKYGILDHTGKVILMAQYDFLRTPYVYVDDLRTMPIIAQKDGKMGLVLPDRKDTIYADFIYDDITLREEPPYFEAVKDGKVTLL